MEGNELLARLAELHREKAAAEKRADALAAQASVAGETVWELEKEIRAVEQQFADRAKTLAGVAK